MCEFNCILPRVNGISQYKGDPIIFGKHYTTLEISYIIHTLLGIPLTIQISAGGTIFLNIITLQSFYWLWIHR